MFLQYFLMRYGMAFSSDVNKFWDCSISFFVIVSVVWHRITFRTLQQFFRKQHYWPATRNFTVNST